MSELLRGRGSCTGDVVYCRLVMNSEEFEWVNRSGVPIVLDCTLGGGGGGVMPLSTPYKRLLAGENREDQRKKGGSRS